MLHTKTVSPSILHSEQDKNCKYRHEDHEGTALCPQMHKNQNRKQCLHKGDYHHADEHLAGINILICDHELDSSQSQQADINYQVLAGCVFFMLFGDCHIFSSLVRLMGKVQQIHQRHHKHPNQIHEVPVEAHDLKIVGVVTATFVTQADGDEGDNATRDVREVQAGDAEKRRAEQSGSPRILKQRHAFVDQRQPFPNVQKGEYDAERRRDHSPTKCSALITGLG